MLILVLVLVCGLVTNSPAVEWQLKEMGVGVYDESQGYDTVLTYSSGVSAGHKNSCMIKAILPTGKRNLAPGWWDLRWTAI